MTNAPMTDVREATKKYGGGPPALAGVTLSTASGDCVGILGHADSGTSTPLNLTAGWRSPPAAVSPSTARASTSSARPDRRSTARRLEDAKGHQYGEEKP
ncbi:hypothetical protein AB0C76_20685 [Kitasatospora sp. NPDC048722]|uniref:hypothetical protein n=1 Tax=Kitasatospora sp. NPDC048722 TaxID=3155639 RepID=UPI0033C78A53